MNKEIFDLKMGKISKHSAVDFALWGGIVGDYDDQPGSVKNNMNDLVIFTNAASLHSKALPARTAICSRLSIWEMSERHWKF